VACSSGTAALHLAIEALGIPQGSEVITNDLSMVACPRAIVMAGMVPVFVDCWNDLQMDLDLLSRVTNFGSDVHAEAILVAHIYGRRVNMKHLVEAAAPTPALIIEDMSELHGIKPHPGTAAACWSFYKNKVLAGEEGGMVAFRSKEHADKARELRSLGFTEAHDFMHRPRGHNYRMSNAHAKLVLDSLAAYPINVGIRRLMESAYERYCPQAWKMPERAAPWVYDIRIPGMTSETQTRVVKALQENGIRARHAFKPMSMQEEFKDCAKMLHARHRAAVMAREVIYLPLDVADVILAKRAFEVIRETLN
jgi:perosamine synthetase